MSIDVGALLAKVGPLAEAAVTSSGTVVTIRRDTNLADDTTIDPTTLAATDPTAAAVVKSNVPALILPDASRQIVLGPDTRQEQAAYRVLLQPAITDLKVNDQLLVTASRDPALKGRVLTVTDVGADSTGVLRQLRAEAR